VHPTDSLPLSSKHSWVHVALANYFSLDVVTKYISNQKEHHKKKTFREEYLDFLIKFQVDYKAVYLFDFMD